MTISNSKNQKELRLLRNADILRRMRNGDPLNAVDSRASWFPPRPIIKKDLAEMGRLYRTDVDLEEKKQWEKKNNIRLLKGDSEDQPLPEVG